MSRLGLVAFDSHAPGSSAGVYLTRDFCGARTLRSKKTMPNFTTQKIVDQLIQKLSPDEMAVRMQEIEERSDPRRWKRRAQSNPPRAASAASIAAAYVASNRVHHLRIACVQCLAVMLTMVQYVRGPACAAEEAPFSSPPLLLRLLSFLRKSG